MKIPHLYFFIIKFKKMKRIKITENHLKKIVESEVKENLEKKSPIDTIDITKIDIQILRDNYRDFRLTPFITAYDNLSEGMYIKGLYNETEEPDTVIKNIIQRYNLTPQLIRKVKQHNNIYVYSIVANIGINDKLIEDDMEKMGYFLSLKKPVKVDDMDYYIMQFEPTWQLQNDETDNIKSKYNYLYHWTPDYNIDEILEKGLFPLSKNNIFNYPPRIYLIKGDASKELLLQLGTRICFGNLKNSKNTNYTLLKIDIRNIDDNIRFFFDPNSEIGIYTEQPISSKYISVYTSTDFLDELQNGIRENKKGLSFNLKKIEK